MGLQAEAMDEIYRTSSLLSRTVALTFVSNLGDRFDCIETNSTNIVRAIVIVTNLIHSKKLREYIYK